MINYGYGGKIVLIRRYNRRYVGTYCGCTIEFMWEFMRNPLR
jgi:hypothetical protein